MIVHLTAGGAESMMKRLILMQQSGGEFEHRVVSLRGKATIGRELESKGVAVDALGIHSARNALGGLWKLLRIIRGWRPDVVQTWMYHGDLLGGLAARLAGVKAIAWNVRIAEIGTELGVSAMTVRIRRVCARLSYIVPRRVVFVADSARRSHEKDGYDPRRSITIRNGYAIPDDQTSADRDRYRRIMGASKDTLLVASAGRFNRQKNPSGFVRACAIVADFVPHARFVMFGQNIDQHNSELMRCINTSGHAEKFQLMGEKRDLQDWLNSVDLFCLHSLAEGFPNVVAEAMAGGVPCIATDVGDASAIIGDTGWIVQPDDDRALADLLCRALTMDEADRRSYGRRARQRIEGRFSMPVIAGQYARMYRQMVRHPNVARLKKG